MNDKVKPVLRLIHYLFPIALGWSISLVMARATGLPLEPAGVYLFLAGVAAAYSLDRLADSDKSTDPQWLRTILLATFIIASISGFFASLQLSLKTLSVVTIFSLASLLYRRLKRFPLFKTALVAIVWTWAGAALPIKNNDWLAWRWWSIGACLPLVLSIAAGCILCDLKDLESDSRAGVRSLPVLMGINYTTITVVLLSLIAAGLSFYQGRSGLFISSSCLMVISQFPSLISLEAIGPLLIDLILTIPGILIAARLV